MDHARDAVPEAASPVPRISRYAWYALFVLFLVYVMNFVDRQIISILAPYISHDLSVADDDIAAVDCAQRVRPNTDQRPSTSLARSSAPIH